MIVVCLKWFLKQNLIEKVKKSSKWARKPCTVPNLPLISSENRERAENHLKVDLGALGRAQGPRKRKENNKKVL